MSPCPQRRFPLMQVVSFPVPPTCPVWIWEMLKADWRERAPPLQASERLCVGSGAVGGQVRAAVWSLAGFLKVTSAVGWLS